MRAGLALARAHPGNTPAVTAQGTIGVGARDYTLPLPPNRTGGSPASGSPVSGFVVVRLYASTRVLLPRTAPRGGQTIGYASGHGRLQSLCPVHPAAIAANCAVVFECNHPPSQTCWLCYAGSTHTSPARLDSRPPRFPSDSGLPFVRS